MLRACTRAERFRPCPGAVAAVVLCSCVARVPWCVVSCVVGNGALRMGAAKQLCSRANDEAGQPLRLGSHRARSIFPLSDSLVSPQCEAKCIRKMPNAHTVRGLLLLYRHLPVASTNQAASPDGSHVRCPSIHSRRFAWPRVRQRSLSAACEESALLNYQFCHRDGGRSGAGTGGGG